MPSVLHFHNCSTFQKNKSGSIIILYDEDERIAPDVATKFVQRDVDNVFILSGGEVEIDTSAFLLLLCVICLLSLLACEYVYTTLHK